MNARGNALGQGNRANSTIGRALQLVARNVGGGRPGVEDRAAHGQPGKVGAAFAERLEDSPFDGLAQDRGGRGRDRGSPWSRPRRRGCCSTSSRASPKVCARRWPPRWGDRPPQAAPGLGRPGRARPRAWAHLPRGGLGPRPRARPPLRPHEPARPATSCAAPAARPRASRSASSPTPTAGGRVRRARPHPAGVRRRQRRSVLDGLRIVGRRGDRLLGPRRSRWSRGDQRRPGHPRPDGRAR